MPKLDRQAARTATLLVGGIYGGLALLFGLSWAWSALLAHYPHVTLPATLVACAVLVFVGCWVTVYREEVRLARRSEERDAASAPR